MFKSLIETTRAYLLSEPPPANASEQHKQELMRKLDSHVAANDATSVASLLDNSQDRGIIAQALKASPYSPLHHAAAQGKEKALKAMLEKLPLDIWNIRTHEKQRTPLMLAAENGRDLAIYEFRNGFNHHIHKHATLSPAARSTPVNDTPKRPGWPPNNQHASHQWQAIANARDSDGNTPLLLAVQNNHLCCCNALLTVRLGELGARNKLGQSALSIARQSPDSELYRILHHHLASASLELYRGRRNRARRDAAIQTDRDT